MRKWWWLAALVTLGASAATTITAAPGGGWLVRTVPAPTVQACASPALAALVAAAIPDVQDITARTPQYAPPTGRTVLRCVALAHGRQYRITYTTNAARTAAQARVEPGGSGR